MGFDPARDSIYDKSENRLTGEPILPARSANQSRCWFAVRTGKIGSPVRRFIILRSSSPPPSSPPPQGESEGEEEEGEDEVEKGCKSEDDLLSTMREEVEVSNLFQNFFL